MNKPTIREQLETLVVQNFKDAWEEGLLEHIQDLMEQGILEVDEKWLREQDWSEMKVEFLQGYLENLGELITQKSGLFERKG